MITLRINDPQQDPIVPAGTEGRYTPPQPLSNAEIDENFQFLNREKLDINGDIPVKKLSFFTSENLSSLEVTANESNTLNIQGNIHVHGTITQHGAPLESEYVNEDYFNISADKSLTQILDALSALRFGNDGYGSLLEMRINGDEENPRFEFVDGESDLLPIRAKNIVTDEYGTFDELYTEVDSIEQRVDTLENYDVATIASDIVDVNETVDELQNFVIHDVVQINSIGVTLEFAKLNIVDTSITDIYLPPDGFGILRIKLLGSSHSLTIKTSNGNDIDEEGVDEYTITENTTLIKPKGSTLWSIM